MGKKGGKKKGKGKKSGGGGKKGKGGDKEDQMTVQEAVMALDIQRKEKAVEDLMFEIKGLQEKNKRHQARNVRLNEERELHMKNLLQQAREMETAADESKALTCSDVEKAMRELWARQRIEDIELKNLNMTIEKTNIEYEHVYAQVEMWRLYRDVGAKQHSDQVELLQLDLEDMKKNFDEVCAHLKRQLDAAKAEIQTEMEQCMQEQQHEASEKAMELMDKQGVREIHENEWLKKEAQIHRTDVESLCKLVESLELENIRLISELVDCQVEDLKIHRNFANAGFEGEEDAMDRKALSIYDPNYKSPTGTPARAISSRKERPKSALLKAIEDKVFSIETQGLDEEDEEEEDEEDEQTILDQQEYLHLGPLELKLLCVQGEAKPIHPIDSGIQIVDGSSSELTVTRPKWPISPPMLRSVEAAP